MNALGPFPPWPAERREASRRATLAAAPVAGPVWVFGYGSLIWDPRFRHLDRRRASLRGYGRAFCFWSVRGRGTPERPGLGLSLVESRTVTHGLAFRLDPAHFDADLPALWRREMVNGVYRPAWLPLETEAGELQAITFVADPGHPQFAGRFGAEVQARYLRQGAGTRGRSRDYLARLVAGLHEMGLPDPALDDLLARVDGIGRWGQS